MNKLSIKKIVRHHYAVKVANIMRICILLLIIGVTQALGMNLYSQTALINLRMNNATVEDVINGIEEQSEFRFLYNKKIVDVESKVSILANNESITSVLDNLFRDADISYAISDRQIVLNKKGVFLTILPSIAQQSGRRITGTVTDANGETIIGANILEKGTTNGAVTDIDGHFSLNIKERATLVVSYIGFKSAEVNVGNQQTLTIRLTEDSQALEEVVVIGYGTQRRSDVTTAVSSVSADNLRDRSSVNFGEALAGQVAGVMIQQINGMPGGEGLAIRVRGTGSITSSTDPLYVVDGYPMEDAALNLINPSEIETIQILKDASSTAIYGSRGANGVVIITTKKGQSGKPTVKMNAYVGFQQVEKKVEMMNRDQYVQWFIDGRNQAWLDATVIADDPDRSAHTINDSNTRRSLYPSASTQYMIPDGTGGYQYNFLDPASVAQLPDNDWQDLLFRNAPLQQYDLSVSGGSENARYTFSGSYTNQEGIVLNTGYERFNFRTNLSSKITKNFEIGMSLMAYASSGKEQANGKDAPILYALNLPPIYPLRNEDGSYGSMVRNPEILAGDVANPIGIAEQVYDQRNRNGWLGTIFAEWEIIKGLKYRIGINGGIRDNTRKNYRASFIDFDASKAP
ncbi:MAG: SusC/RagA family TonB-linked outer membrane protein, partial [Tannerella sp.]|nr:SusC/RagA family TonB-linked outer membrane protein [Tannerella sp.]